MPTGNNAASGCRRTGINKADKRRKESPYAVCEKRTGIYYDVTAKAQQQGQFSAYHNIPPRSFRLGTDRRQAALLHIVCATVRREHG